MSPQPPSPSDFHGRAATLLTGGRGVTQPQALVALADAATGLLGICLEQTQRDTHVLDLETKLSEAQAVYHRLAALAQPSVQLRHLVDELRLALFGPSLEDF